MSRILIIFEELPTLHFWQVCASFWKNLRVPCLQAFSLCQGASFGREIKVICIFLFGLCRLYSVHSLSHIDIGLIGRSA